MVHVVDRRSNHNKNKSLSNRKRYIDRAKEQVREAVNKKIEKGKLQDLIKGDKVKVKIKGTKEPTFQQDFETGEHDFVVPGNKNFESGDQIPRPKSGKGKGSKAGNGEDTEDDFSFVLTKEEYLDILFEDLELPDLIKKEMKDLTNVRYERRGFQTTGSPSAIDIQRTAKNALGRRIALKRPKNPEVENLKKKIEELVAAKGDTDEIFNLKQTLLELIRKQKSVPWLDPIDVKYRRFEKIPNPVAHAVMFCVMDVSGSMGEHEKDIAKRFFLLLYLFLAKKYEKVEVRFVRHTTDAQEVDEATFFNDPLSGGTKISPALELVDNIITKDYDVSKTNIYIAQASDGDNTFDDDETCYDIVVDKLIKKIQYLAYIEIFNEDHTHRSMGFRTGEEDEDDDEGKGLWKQYIKINKQFKQLQCRKIGHQRHIFNVFQDLFKKKTED